MPYEIEVDYDADNEFSPPGLPAMMQYWYRQDDRGVWRDRGRGDDAVDSQSGEYREFGMPAVARALGWSLEATLAWMQDCLPSRTPQLSVNALSSLRVTDAKIEAILRNEPGFFPPVYLGGRGVYLRGLYGILDHCPDEGDRVPKGALSRIPITERTVEILMRKLREDVFPESSISEGAKPVRRARVSIGAVYGRGRVLRRVQRPDDSKHAWFELACTCATTYCARGDDLLSRKVKSCGCAQRENHDAYRERGPVVILPDTPIDYERCWDDSPFDEE